MEKMSEIKMIFFLLALQLFRVAFISSPYIREIISTAVSRDCVWHLVNDERNCTIFRKYFKVPTLLNG